MRRTLHFSTVVALLALITTGFAQGGSGGTGGGGGGFGGGGGQFGGGAFGGSQAGRGTGQATYSSKVRLIEDRLNRYLDTPEVKNILTPGEYSEWTLTLTAGDVVIADARSDAFDPALEIIEIMNEGEEDEEIVTYVTNDDRFPGDQRPLIIWRCEKDAVYLLRARCFQDKSGGQFFLRSKTFKSVDLTGETAQEITLDGEREFLVKVPLKAGEIRKIVFENLGDEGYTWGAFDQVISPIGLPDIQLTQSLSGILRDAVMASVDGDYYVIIRTSGDKGEKVRLKTQEIMAVDIVEVDGKYSATAKPNQLSLWKFEVKEGDILEVALPELTLSSRFVVSEYPDITDYDMKDIKKNPFFPQPLDEEKDNKGPAYVELPGRARDSRIAVYVVQRDAELWIATDGYKSSNGSYTLSIHPKAKEFTAAKVHKDKLRIGYTEYWSFEAKAGDVMTFHSVASEFAGSIVVRDPELRTVWNGSVTPDQSSMDWNMIINKPGKYLVAVSAIGDGGGGEYSMEREEFSAREFSKGTHALGDFSSGQAEVWKFTATPDSPLLVHWKSSNREYSVSIIDEDGKSLSLPMTTVDNSNQFGILKVSEKRTFVIVLISNGKKSSYDISLSDIPGLSSSGK